MAVLATNLALALTLSLLIDMPVWKFLRDLKVAEFRAAHGEGSNGVRSGVAGRAERRPVPPPAAAEATRIPATRRRALSNESDFRRM